MKTFWFLRRIGKRLTQLITLVTLIALVYIVYVNKGEFNFSKSLSSPKSTLANDDISTQGFVKASILYVVDGDTIVVMNEDREEVKVRMIGVNTPESVHSDASKNTKEGKIASDYTKSVLKEGMIVYLEYDKDKQDQYGRDLAYVWLKDDVDTSSYEDFCKYNYGAILLQNTYCEAVYYEPNGQYKVWYEQLDTEN